MSFADPMSIDYAAGEKSFSKVPSSQPNKSRYIYIDASGNELEFNVTQSNTSQRKRHEIRLSKTVVAADPITSVNKSVSASVMIVIDEPNFGFADIDLGLSGLLGSLVDTAQDDSGLVVTKMLLGEI